MGAVARSWGEMAAESLGRRSVEEEAAVARSWDEVATESLGSFLWGRRLRRQELGRGGDREPWERQRALGTLRG